ncbi:MAG: putative selenium-dependent hydroxylase accessory protein YqeC [Syntrophus sp. (in: bacteria)]|nr:putative selenium-dependent hydroxylase accessory protein YqeC [Syntrophus sp. (in: bacteria)]
MWHIQKINPVEKILDAKYITFVGAGGKSSLIEYMVGQAINKKKKTVVTTTTKIYAQEPYMLLTGKTGQDNTSSGNPIRVGKSIVDGKLTAVNFDDILKLGKTFDMVFVEADGAKGKPLKYPAPQEPVIPPFSDRIFVVAGLDSLLGHIGEKVFRWELLLEKKGLTGDEIISSELFRLFFTNEILLKGVEREICTIVLNKFDALVQRQAALEIAKAIILQTGVESIVVSSSVFQIFYEIRQLNP